MYFWIVSATAATPMTTLCGIILLLSLASNGLSWFSQTHTLAIYILPTTYTSHNLEHDSIASVRRQDPGVAGLFHTLSGKEIQAQQGHCLIRVPTVAPVLNRNWFLEQIGRARERHALETRLG